MIRPHLLISVLFLLSTAGVLADGWDDPFATDSALSLRPAVVLASRVGSLPCADSLPSRPLAAVDVLDLAICNNPQTREVWAAARLAAAQIGLARSAWLPTLNSKLSENRVKLDSRYETQKSAALTLSWLAFDFGARDAALENAQQLMLAATATQLATIQNLFLSALQAYYTAQASQAAVSSTQQAEQAAQTSLAAAEVRYRVGAGTPADRLQAQTAFSQATLNRIRAEGEARNALGSLANVMGFEPNKNIVLLPTAMLPSGQAFQRDIDSLMQEAANIRPDLRAAEAQVNAAQAGIEQARAQGRPTVTLTTGPSWQESAHVSSHGGTLGVAVNVPIFAGLDTTYRIRAAQAQVESKSALRDRLRKQVALDVWKAYQSLTTATQTLQTTHDLLASAEQSERVALGRYKAGVGNVIDVLTAQTALASARLQRIQASLDWNVYRATLAQAVGALDYSLLQTAAEGKP
jgi:TolC family type I secretion outer membrane protein